MCDETCDCYSLSSAGKNTIDYLSALLASCVSYIYESTYVRTNEGTLLPGSQASHHVQVRKETKQLPFAEINGS